MRVLALDLSTRTGFAHTDGASGVYRLPQCDHNGARWIHFSGWLERMLAAHGTDCIVYEQAHHRGGAATRLALGLVTETERVAARNDVACKPCHSATLKKYATGNGRADKVAMWEAAKARGIAVKCETDDQLDAIWLLDWALHEL